MSDMNRDKFLSYLGSGECTVVFTKADGSSRRMKCTLFDDLIPEQEVTDGSKRKINEDVIVVWDLEKKAWRSFRVDSVIDFMAPV